MNMVGGIQLNPDVAGSIQQGHLEIPPPPQNPPPPPPPGKLGDIIGVFFDTDTSTSDSQY